MEMNSWIIFEVHPYLLSEGLIFCEKIRKDNPIIIPRKDEILTLFIKNEKRSYCVVRVEYEIDATMGRTIIKVFVRDK